MTAQTSHWVVLALLNIPVYLGLGRWVFFDDWDDFFRCVRYWLTPDVISLFRGEYMDDFWGSTKLVIFVILCAGIVIGEHHLLHGDSDQPAGSSPPSGRPATPAQGAARNLSIQREFA